MPSERLSRTSSVLVFVALAAAMVSGCSLFGPEVKPPAPSPLPTRTPSETYLLLKLGERRLYVVENDVKPAQGYPVAIGQPKWPTPTGRFQVNEMVENPDFLAFDFNNPSNPKNKGRVPPGPNNPLGLRWIGFANAHGWQVGFHGTAKTSVLGQAVSHGCVRMANPDVVEVFKKVKLGTPVVVED